MHLFKSISRKSKSARFRRRSGSLFWRKKLFLIGLGIFFIGTCATLVGLKQFGYFGKIIEIATQSFFIDKIIKPELRVNYIFVEGRSETSSKKLLQSLRLNRGQFILDFKPEEARLRIEKLPWVETAIIERHLPDTIRLTIKEKKPLALWQRNGELLLLDAKGKIINLPNINSYTSLIIIIGKDAPIRAESLFNVLAAVRMHCLAHLLPLPRPLVVRWLSCSTCWMLLTPRLRWTSPRGAAPPPRPRPRPQCGRSSPACPRRGSTTGPGRRSWSIPRLQRTSDR